MTRTLLAALLCAVPALAAPVPKPGDDTDKLLARVKIDNLGSALSQPALAKELNLDADQRKKLDELGKEMGEKAKARMLATKQGGNPNGGPEDMLSALGSLVDGYREYDDAAAKTLTPEQVRRLKQIQLQKEGPAALLGRHAIRALDPTVEQEDKLAAELAKSKKLFMMEEVIAMTSGAIDGQGAGEMMAMNKMLAKHALDVDAVQEAMLKVLTKEQRATWAKMTGEPLPRLELLKAGTMFGDSTLAKSISEAEKTAVQAPPPVAPAPPQPEEKEKK